MMMIAFITFKSSLVPLFEGLWSSNSWEFELSGFRRNRTDDLGIDSPSLDVTRKLHGDSSTGRGLLKFGGETAKLHSETVFSRAKCLLSASKRNNSNNISNKIAHLQCTPSSAIHCDPSRQWCLRFFFGTHFRVLPVWDGDFEVWNFVRNFVLAFFVWFIKSKQLAQLVHQKRLQMEVQ